MSANLVPCPLHAKCLSGTVQGHEPGSKELATCQARANGKTSAPQSGGFDPSRAYTSVSSQMTRTNRFIRRAWGAGGRGIPNLVGPPGIGKSEMVENMAKQMGGDYLLFDVSAKDPDCLSGIPFKPDEHGPLGEDEKSTIEGKARILKAGRLYEADIIEIFYREPDAKPLIVFFDEINGGKEAMMSSLQKILTSRTLPEEGKVMNDNVYMVAAMNDAEHTSNGNDLSAAMVSRLTPLNIVPDFTEWVNGESTFWGKGFNKDRFDRIASDMDENAPSSEQYLEAVTHVAHFLEEMGHPNKKSAAGDDSTLNIFSEPLDEDALTEKHGQPRSWSKAIEGIAMAVANPDPEDKDGSAATQEYAQIVKMNCGTRASRDFVNYHETHRDLPDIKGALEKGTLDGKVKEWKAAGRSDIPMFALSVLGSSEYDHSADRMGKAMDLMAEIGAEYPDMAASRIAGSIDNWSKDMRETLGGGSPEYKAFANTLLTKIKDNPPIAAALGTRSAGSYLVGGTASAEEVAVSSAKSRAKADKK